jgi:hypothetical protein
VGRLVHLAGQRGGVARLDWSVARVPQHSRPGLRPTACRRRQTPAVPPHRCGGARATPGALPRRPLRPALDQSTRPQRPGTRAAARPRR